MKEAEKLKLIELLEKEKDKCPCGKYCVQDGRNEGLDYAIKIVEDNIL